MRLRVFHHLVESVFHEVKQALVHFALAPEEALTVLDPFEIAHRYPAGVAENVWHGEDTLAIDDRVVLPGCWTVCAFAENLGLPLIATLFGNLVFNRRGNGNLAGLKEHIPRAHFGSATPET